MSEINVEKLLESIKESREFVITWKDDYKREDFNDDEDKWKPLGFEKKFALTPNGYIIELPFR